MATVTRETVKTTKTIEVDEEIINAQFTPAEHAFLVAMLGNTVSNAKGINVYELYVDMLGGRRFKDIPGAEDFHRQIPTINLTGIETSWQ